MHKHFASPQKRNKNISFYFKLFLTILYDLCKLYVYSKIKINKNKRI